MTTNYNYGQTASQDPNTTTKKIPMFSKQSAKRFLYTTAIATLAGAAMGETGKTTFMNMNVPNCLLIGTGVGVGAELGAMVAPTLETAVLGDQTLYARNFETQVISVATATVAASVVSSYVGGIPFSMPLVLLAGGSHVAGEWSVNNWDILGFIW